MLLLLLRSRGEIEILIRLCFCGSNCESSHFCSTAHPLFLQCPFDSHYSSFDLGTPVSIKEAIFALDYIDHDFYVFRDEETNEISVVYKRNAGGVGLIQPE